MEKLKYVCYECKNALSSDINKRFIDSTGKCLCNICSKGKEPMSKNELEILKKYQKIK